MERIGRSVSDALERMSQGKHEGALRDICGAIEGTLKKHGAGGRSHYKAWAASNLDLILAMGFPGLRTAGLRIAYSHPDLPVTNPPNTPSLEEIIYHVIRCELYHTGGLPDDIKFSDGVIGGATLGQPLRIPSDFVLGIILSVLASEPNIDEHMDANPELVCNGVPLSLNSFWGKKTALMDALAFTRIASGIPGPRQHQWQMTFAT